MKKRALVFALVVLTGQAHAAAFQPTVNPLLPVQNSPLASLPIRNNFQATYNDLISVAALGSGGGGSGTVTTVSCSATPPVVCSVGSPTTTPALSLSLSSAGITFGSTLVNLGSTVSGFNGVDLGDGTPAAGNFTTLTATTPLGTASGGLGVSTTPANGAIPIGNGSGYTVTPITAGSNITVTNGPGSIIIAATTTASQSVSLSAVTSATGANTIDNTNNPQTWKWGTLSTATALSFTSSSETTGQVLNVSVTNPASTGYAGYFSNTGTNAAYSLYSTITGTAASTGYAGYFNASTTGVGYGIYSTTASTGTGYGVYGAITGAANTGYAGYFSNTVTTTGYALYANGRANVTGAVTLGALTTGALTSNGTGVLSSGTLANSFLTNSSVTVSPGTGLTGGGAVALGATTTLSLSTPVGVANGGTGIASGTSGGILAFTGSTTIASSGALTANRPVIGGGAGAAPSVGTVTGNTTLFATATGSTPSGDLASWDANGNAVDAGVTVSNQKIRSIEFVIDGGGSTITTGVKGFLMVPFACTITKATLLGDQTGSIVVDIWAKAFASTLPTVANTITASDIPTLSSAVTMQDSTLTGWTTSIAANSMIGFNVNSVTTLTRVTVALQCAGS